MTEFATALKEQLEADPKLSRKGERLLKVLKARPSRRKERQLRRMEAHSRAQLGYSSSEAVDWEAIDWKGVLGQLLQMLLKLLPFLLML